MSISNYPSMTEFEHKVFMRFVRRYTPGYAGNDSVQLEGDKQLAACAAGHRLMKKGIVIKIKSCFWLLTELGKAMAEAEIERNGRSRNDKA